MPVNPVNAGILVLGLLMLGTGIQALRQPTLNALLAETVVTVLLLVWNIGMAVINVDAADRFDKKQTAKLRDWMDGAEEAAVG